MITVGFITFSVGSGVYSGSGSSSGAMLAADRVISSSSDGESLNISSSAPSFIWKCSSNSS